mmetsp:Transcript_12990/g.21042  ORF Transcript_12990/g.21042 Transcript_12990/m.21042 type:complete len:287 (-) Transcript_12990:1030-1890(-)
MELKILETIKKQDPDQTAHVIHIVESFFFRTHLCFSFDMMSLNLYELIKINQFKGFPLACIQHIAKQLFECLLFLRENKIIHCDLKPENILIEFAPTHATPPTKPGCPKIPTIRLPDGKYAQTIVKVIDFGSSCFMGEQVFTYIQSRFYRAPEVILGMKYGYEIDTWSTGCILAELLQGYPLFPGENEGDQLSCIMEVCGQPPLGLLGASKRLKVFFNPRTGQPLPFKNSRKVKRTPLSKSLTDLLGCGDFNFVGFLDQCLTIDHRARITPESALAHPFFKINYRW